LEFYGGKDGIGYGFDSGLRLGYGFKRYYGKRCAADNDYHLEPCVQRGCAGDDGYKRAGYYV
jgi:hypothetical protein